MSISVALAVVWSFFRPVAFSDSLMKVHSFFSSLRMGNTQSLLDYTNHPVVIQLKEVDESIRTEIIERVNDIQLTLVSFNISEKEKREKFRLFMVDAPKEALVSILPLIFMTSSERRKGTTPKSPEVNDLASKKAPIGTSPGQNSGGEHCVAFK